MNCLDKQPTKPAPACITKPEAVMAKQPMFGCAGLFCF